MKEIAITIPADSPSRIDVYRMFDRISGRYDLVNRILSLGMDIRWRRKAIEALEGSRSHLILDLACGTGDMIDLALADLSSRTIVGLDRSKSMLQLAKSRFDRSWMQRRVSLVCGDGASLPIPDHTYDAVTIAFGIRNMPDTLETLKEMHRLLKKNGSAVILEFSLPKNRFMRVLHLFYLRNVVPVVGRMLSGDSYAYSYLNKTIETFPHGKRFSELMQTAGFDNINVQPLTSGIVSIYTGRKN